MQGSRYIAVVVAVLAISAVGEASARVSHGYSATFAIHTITGLADEAPPAMTRITSVYPNPFNPRATLVYEVAEAGPLTLSIFDLRGRLIREVVATTSLPGRYEVDWDGRDDGGRECPSGTYLCRLAARDVEQQIKMTLAR